MEQQGKTIQVLQAAKELADSEAEAVVLAEAAQQRIESLESENSSLREDAAEAQKTRMVQSNF